MSNHWEQPECPTNCGGDMELEEAVVRDDGLVLARFRCSGCWRTRTQALNDQEEVKVR